MTAVNLLFQRILAAAVLVLVPAARLIAQESVLQLEPEQTTIDFTLASVLHTVHGTFKLKEGKIRFDPAAGTAIGSVVVDATSGYSGNGTRDRKMHKDVLESQKYPEITFFPGEVHGNLVAGGSSEVELTGTLNLHGSEQAVSVKVLVQISGDRLSANTHLVIPYVKWGLRNPSTLFLRVSDKVDVDIRAAGRLAALSKR